MTANEPASDPMTLMLGALLQQAVAAADVAPFAVRLWSGARLESHPGAEPAFTLVIDGPDAVGRMLARTDFLSLGEAFLRGDFDIEGDVEAVFPLGEALRAAKATEQAEAPSVDTAYVPPDEAAHEKGRDAASIEYHYDMSNTAMGYITGPTRVYSSAYYNHPDDTLDQAQRNKLDRVVGKLRIQPGERVLDIGCGWGTMLTRAAEIAGVTAVGVTVSKAQHQFVQGLLSEAGLTERVAVHLQDYRDIEGTFDKIVSLGMVEHVGVANLPTYFAKAFSLLAPGGLFLCQGCTSNVANATEKVSPFAQHYLFPDAEFPYLTRYLRAAEEAGFEVVDVENLREHYARTHRAWRHNLEGNRAAIVEEIGDRRYRALRMLFAYATHYFRRHLSAVHQMLLYKPDGMAWFGPRKRLL